MKATLFVLLAACSSAATPSPELVSCELAADRNLQARVDKECRGIPLSSCPAHDDIMKQLKAEQEACP